MDDLAKEILLLVNNWGAHPGGHSGDRSSDASNDGDYRQGWMDGTEALVDAIHEVAYKKPICSRCGKPYSPIIGYCTCPGA